MTFNDIAKKNLKFNIRKYSSFFFVNGFVVCVLFLFGSLLFNDILNADPAIQAAQSMVVMAAVGITLFSIIFLTYTGIYFIRSRGREFGVYLTLGMTSDNLTKMVTMESAVIFAAAAVLGIAGALMLGHLFYLALARIIGVQQNLFFIDHRSFLYSLGLLVLIFFAQRFMTAKFIRNLSIVEIMKSGKTKGLTASSQSVIGIVATVSFITSSIVLHAIATGASWIIDIVRGVEEFIIIPPMVVMIVSMFYMIGSGVAGVALLVKKFPRIYNRNILLLAGLTHKFRAYRISLFNVTLLVTFAVFFIGIAMSFFIYGRLTLDVFQPHDFMIEQRGEINIINENEIMQIVNDAGGEIENFQMLPYVDSVVYRTLNQRDGLFVNFRQNSFLVSESNFNNFSGMNISLAPHELLIVTNNAAAYNEGIDFDTMLVVEPSAIGIERAETLRQENLDRAGFEQILGDALVIEFTEANTSTIHFPFTNSHGTMEFISSHANVVNDEVFEKLTEMPLNSLIAFDLARGSHEEVMAALLQELLTRNNLPENAWQSATEFSLIDRDHINNFRPISRYEREEILTRANSFLLFVMSFLGFLFLISASIVLYCKFTADSDDEKDNVVQLKRVGLTVPECKRYLGSHIAIVFYLPLFFGGLLGLMLTYSFVSMVDEAWFLTSRVAIMYSVVVIFGTFVYGALRRRFFKDVVL